MNFEMTDCRAYYYLIVCIQDGANQGSIALVGTQLLHIGKLVKRSRDVCRCIVYFNPEAKSKCGSNGKHVYKKRGAGAKGLGALA
jgi:hypothetical protein